MENQGWISLHRKLIDWEWYQNSNVKCLFLHLLLTANFKEKQWKGITIKRGQVLVGRGELSKILDLSEQQVRTAKNKLKSTNEITSQPTNRYSIITVLNYDLYQDNNQQLNQQITNKQPTDNQQITTTNNDNKENKRENPPKVIKTKRDLNKRKDYLQTLSESEITTHMQKYLLSREEVLKEAEKAHNYNLANKKVIHDYAASFSNWLIKSKEYKAQNDSRFNKNVTSSNLD